MSLDLITEIQASPREFAQKYETMRAALAALTARLAEVTAEREAARAGWKDELSAHSTTNDLAISLSGKLGAARAEVARLTAELATATTEVSQLADGLRGANAVISQLRQQAVRLTAALNTLSKPVNELKYHLSKDGEFSICRTDKEDMGWGDTMVLGKIMEDIDAALRGDTAPATGRE